MVLFSTDFALIINPEEHLIILQFIFCYIAECVLKEQVLYPIKHWGYSQDITKHVCQYVHVYNLIYSEEGRVSLITDINTYLPENIHAHYEINTNKTGGPWALTPFLRTNLAICQSSRSCTYTPFLLQGSKLSLLSLYEQQFPRYVPIFKIAIFGHKTWSLTKVPEVANLCSFLPIGS